MTSWEPLVRIESSDRACLWERRDPLKTPNIEHPATYEQHITALLHAPQCDGVIKRPRERVVDNDRPRLKSFYVESRASARRSKDEVAGAEIRYRMRELWVLNQPLRGFTQPMTC